MANYIGNQPSLGEFKRLDSIASSFNGSTTQFSLTYNSVSHSVGDASQLIVSLNGIIQEPLNSYTLGIGGSSIVFASAPESGDQCFIISLGGVGNTTSTVADRSITSVKLATTGVTAGEYGSGTAIPVISVDDEGRITAASTTTVAGVSSLSLAGDTLTLSTADGGSYTADFSAYATDTDLSTGLSTKQDTLVSGTNIKTLNGSSVLGSGDLVLGAQQDVFYENSQTLTTSYTITSGKSAMSAGPVTLDTGVTATIPSGSRWVIV
jgi:hypothetical protein